MAETGEPVSYAELEARSNRLAHLLRARGLGRLDHYAIFMENHARYLESCAAGVRAGLYYTCVNSCLTPNELGYILDNSESRILITSQAKRSVALAALAQCPKIELCLVANGPGEGGRVQNLIFWYGAVNHDPPSRKKTALLCSWSISSLRLSMVWEFAAGANNTAGISTANTTERIAPPCVNQPDGSGLAGSSQLPPGRSGSDPH
jgi:acyl-CoA synthetase (AMP-forming)/AMP-acid ligase II